MISRILPFVSPLEVVLMIMLFLMWKDGAKYKDHERKRYDEYLTKLLERMETDAEGKAQIALTLESINAKVESIGKG